MQAARLVGIVTGGRNKTCNALLLAPGAIAIAIVIAIAAGAAYAQRRLLKRRADRLSQRPACRQAAMQDRKFKHLFPQRYALSIGSIAALMYSY